MFTANSKYYNIGTIRKDGSISLVDKKDGSKLYAFECKFFDMESGIALLYKAGTWSLTKSSARVHQNVNIRQILDRAKVECK